MSLTDDWNKKRDENTSKNIRQLVSYIGSGHLKDGNNTSLELREFLSVVGSDELITYVKQCMEDSSNSENPFVFQDIVNEAGSRLGFEVESGLYQGVHGRENNYDGLWKSADGFSLIVEVKTSTTYQISLEKIDGYVERLSQEGKVDRNKSSILIVVGRGSTEALEQQIRGSRYAWDIRVISADSLLSLVKIKENLDTPDTEDKILAVLRPHEYTRIDEIVDLVFSVTKDIQTEDESERPSNETESENTSSESEIKAATLNKRTHNHPIQFYEECVEKIQKVKKWNLVRKSRSAWHSVSDNKLVILLNSREYESDTKPNYWFALHKHQLEQLNTNKDSFLALGCGNADQILMFPRDYVEQMLPKLGKTGKEARMWWHIVIKKESDKLLLDPNRPNKIEDVSKFLLV